MKFKKGEKVKLAFDLDGLQGGDIVTIYKALPKGSKNLAIEGEIISEDQYWIKEYYPKSPFAAIYEAGFIKI